MRRNSRLRAWARHGAVISGAIDESAERGGRRAAVVRRGIGEGLEFVQVLRIRNVVRDERNAERRLQQRIVTELQVAQRAIHAVARVVVQRRGLCKLRAGQHEHGEHNQQVLPELAELVELQLWEAIQHGTSLLRYL